MADTGRDPEPLQRLSTRQVYVVTRRLDALLDLTPLSDRGALERQLADLVGNVVVTKINQIAAERISPRPRRRRLLKSSRLRSASCSWVPMAPSRTMTRFDNVSSMSVSYAWVFGAVIGTSIVVLWKKSVVALRAATCSGFTLVA